MCKVISGYMRRNPAGSEILSRSEGGRETVDVGDIVERICIKIWCLWSAVKWIKTRADSFKAPTPFCSICDRERKIRYPFLINSQSHSPKRPRRCHDIPWSNNFCRQKEVATLRKRQNLMHSTALSSPPSTRPPQPGRTTCRPCPQPPSPASPSRRPVCSTRRQPSWSP